MRKQNEATQPRNTMRTPQEFSRLKWDREQQQQESARLYQQQIMQQRERVSLENLHCFRDLTID